MMAGDNFKQAKEAEQASIQSFAFVIAGSVCVLFCVSFAVSGLIGFEPSHEIELENRINPNDAPLASLVRLPGIGLGRAEAIMVYREDFSAENGNRAAFENCDDLQKVKGVGPKTVQNIGEWLKFE